ncbi:MAG: alpha-glucosidase [Lachnospiraceae bacterium]|nr:alpha-glucosidase [Lachnospiraceae bacterium]
MEKKWWHDKVAYQIYPKSFMDSNGDGIGDLQGIISRLDYLKDLGVDILWLSPIYKSPLADEGYDISDYYAIDPRFGSMQDMEELIAEAKKRGMTVLMDLVVNHCSDEHEWFKKACEDPDGQYGKYFYLRDKGPEGKLPTNWRSYFGGPCWDELPGTDKLYMHVFHRKQPDLNWENPELREEVYKNIRWWMEKGIGGFRIDAIINIKKPAVLHDYPADRDDGLSSVDNMLMEAEGIGEFLGEMRDKAFAPYDAFTVGEVFNEKEGDLPLFIGENGYFSTMFDFSVEMYEREGRGWFDKRPVDINAFRDCMFSAHKKIGDIGFYSTIIENHDEPRGASRLLSDEIRNESAKKALATVYFMRRGLPFIYQGQEIGMENKKIRSVEELDDISSIDAYKVAIDAGLTKEEALETLTSHSRDNARTPMQWSGEAHAGFTTGDPWLKENPNYTSINVEEQQGREDSVLSYYKKLIALRKDPAYKETIVYGDFVPCENCGDNLIAYLRKGESQTILVAGNFNPDPKTVELPLATGGRKVTGGKVLLDNGKEALVEDGSAYLAGFGAAVILLED